MPPPPPPQPPSDGDNDNGNFHIHDKAGSLEEYFAQRLEAEGKSINSTTKLPSGDRIADYDTETPSLMESYKKISANKEEQKAPPQQQERRRIQIPRPTLKFIPLAPETETHYKETIPEEIAAAASHDNGDGNSSGDEDNSLHDIDQDENSDGEDAVWAATTTTTTTNSNADHSNQEEEEEFDTNSYRPRASNPNRFRTYPQLMAKMTTETPRWVTQRKKQQQQKSRQSQKQQPKQPQKKQPLPEGFPTSTRNESLVGEQIEMERLERTIVDTSATTRQTPEYSSFQLGTLSSATNTTAPFKEPPTNRKRETVILNTLGLDMNPKGRRRKPRHAKSTRKLQGKHKKKKSYLPTAYDDDDPPGYHSFPSKSIRQQLVEQGEQVPWHEYVLLQHIPAVSTLASVLEAINGALDRQVLQQQGILDLEAHVNLQRQDDQDLPILSMSDMFPQLQLEEEREQRQPKKDAAATDDVDNDDSNEPNNNSNSQEEQHAKQHQPYFPLHDEYRWVQEAKVVLGPFGRPAGWKLKFANRSIASALLAACEKEPLKVAWKLAVVKTWTEAEERRMTRVDPKEGNTRLEIAFAKPKVDNPEDVFGNNAMYYDDLDTDDLSWLDETVVRVENCARDVSAKNILNVFSRYELATPSVLFWGSPKHSHNAKGNKTRGNNNSDNDNHISMRPSYWIRFADPSWARAALREKQGVHIGGSPIRLIQFPNQYHGRESLQPKQHDDDSDSQPEAA